MKDTYIAVDEATYLKHYGVAGMKWGVRRYQNPDGSFTREGKLRYADYAEKKAVKAIKRRKNTNQMWIYAMGSAAYKATGGGSDRKFRREMKKAQKVQDKKNANLTGEPAKDTRTIIGKLGNMDITLPSVIAAATAGASLINTTVNANALLKTRLAAIDARTGIVMND